MTGDQGLSRGSQGDTEAEAKTTVSAIAGLRRRLKRQDVLDHPLVMRELRKLEEQVMTQLADQTGRSPGRHRSSPGRRDGEQIGDAWGFDLKPDPLKATTPAQFIIALREYKAWSGDPSWRRMARRAGQAVVHSTMHSAMNGDTLPKLDVVKAIINGCGGSDDDQRAFATAWRRIDAATRKSTAPNGRYLAAPVPVLQLLPSG